MFRIFTLLLHLGTSLITAANFCQDGKLAVVGTYDGRCIFYDTEVTKEYFFLLNCIYISFLVRKLLFRCFLGLHN